jgi:hypothetical protein
VLGIATRRALHEHRRIWRANEFLSPHHAQDRSAPHLPALRGLSACPELGMIVGIIPAITPAAGDATDRKRDFAA